jgi:tetratricopeptide (TPR) repeat protein
MQLKTLLSCIACLACLTANAQSAKDLCKLASEAYQKKQYAEAQKYAEQAIAKDSLYIEAYVQKADALTYTKSAQASYNYLNECLANMSDAAELYLCRGILLLNSQPKLAAQDFTEALYYTKVDSIKLKAYTNRASSRMMFRDFSRAHEDLLSAYAIDSNSASVHILLGTVYDELGQGDKVLPHLYKALAHDSNDVITLNNIGFKLQTDKKYQEAIDIYTKILRINDKVGLSYSNRAFCLLQLGKKTEAMEDINRSIKVLPTNSWAYKVRALVHIANDDTKKACKDLQTALDKGYTEQYGEEVRELIKEHCR